MILLIKLLSSLVINYTIALFKDSKETSRIKVQMLNLLNAKRTVNHFQQHCQCKFDLLNKRSICTEHLWVWVSSSLLTYRENLCHKLYKTTAGLFVHVCFLMVHSRLIYALKTQACEDKLCSRHSELAGPMNFATGCETLPSSRVRQTHRSTQTQPAFNRGRNWIYAAKRVFSSHHLARLFQLHAWFEKIKTTHEEGVSVIDMSFRHWLWQYSYILHGTKIYFVFMYHDIYMIL